MKWTCEIVRDSGKYYANLCYGGELIKGLPEYVDYKTLSQAIRLKTGVCILKAKDMIFEKCGRKEYAMIDNTQPRNDCRVRISEILDGYKPDFSDKLV